MKFTAAATRSTTAVGTVRSSATPHTTALVKRKVKPDRILHRTVT